MGAWLELGLNLTFDLKGNSDSWVVKRPRPIGTAPIFQTAAVDRDALDNGCTLKIGKGGFRGLILGREPTTCAAQV